MNENEGPNTVEETAPVPESEEAESRKQESSAADAEKEGEKDHYRAVRRGAERAGYDRAKRELNERIAAAGFRTSTGAAVNTIEELEAMQKAAGDGADAVREIRRLAEDAQSFTKSYPDVDMSALQSSGAFRRFCGSRFGKEPIRELYADYLELTGGVKARERSESKRARTTGSGTGSTGGGLSRGELEELEAWNKAYPAAQMSAKEFLSRKN